VKLTEKTHQLVTVSSDIMSINLMKSVKNVQITVSNVLVQPSVNPVEEIESIYQNVSVQLVNSMTV
jgi:hypothetical protein